MIARTAHFIAAPLLRQNVVVAALLFTSASAGLKIFGVPQPSRYKNYNEFFEFYVSQHADARNRWLHVLGTLMGLAVLFGAFLWSHPWYALLWIPTSYSFAWIGHLLVEGNRPATWKHPWWSFISDFRMVYLMVTGGLRPWLERTASANNKE